MLGKERLVIDAAYKLEVPVKFHTGGWKSSNAIQFYKYCREYLVVNFILAHGNTFSLTLSALK